MNTTLFSPALTDAPSASNLPKVGDVLVSTSGYEACIAHFAKVVEVTKASVKIVRLSSNDTYKQGGMEWTSIPNVDDLCGEVTTKRFKAFENTYKVKDTSYCNFYPWSGEPISCYNYH